MTRASNLAGFTMRVTTALFLAAVENSANGEDPYRSTDLGYAIFSGQRALVAHLRDDNRMVPANAARCINCHGHVDNVASFAPPDKPLPAQRCRTSRRPVESLQASLVLPLPTCRR